MLPVCLQQVPKLFCIGLIFERNLNITDGRGSDVAGSRLGPRDYLAPRAVGITGVFSAADFALTTGPKRRHVTWLLLVVHNLVFSLRDSVNVSRASQRLEGGFGSIHRSNVHPAQVRTNSATAFPTRTRTRPHTRRRLSTRSAPPARLAPRSGGRGIRYKPKRTRALLHRRARWPAG